MARSGLLFFFLASVASADTYVITTAGVWKLSIAQGVPSFSNVYPFVPGDRFISGDSDKSPEPEPKPPVDQTLVGKISTISKNTLKTEQEADALSALFRAIDNFDIADPRPVVKLALDSLLASPSVDVASKRNIQAWRTEVEKLGPYDKTMIKAVLLGLQRGTGVSPTATAEQRSSIADWLPLILQIIELLLKIFGGGK